LTGFFLFLLHRFYENLGDDDLLYLDVDVDLNDDFGELRDYVAY